MSWVFLNDEHLSAVKAGLTLLGTPTAKSASEWINDVTKTGEHDEAFANAAPRQLLGWGDPHEIDQWPFVSQSDDGAYVMAWIWVDNFSAGVPSWYLIEFKEGEEILHAELFRTADEVEAEKRVSEYWNDSPGVLNGDRFTATLFEGQDGEAWDELSTIGGADEEEEAA